MKTSVITFYSKGDTVIFLISNLILLHNVFVTQFINYRILETVTTSLTDSAAMLNLGLVFCRCRFLNSVTYSLLQGLQKCSSSNPSSLDVRGEGTRDARLRMSAGEAIIPGTFVPLGDPPTTLYSQLRLFDFKSPPAEKKKVWELLRRPAFTYHPKL